MATTEKQSLPDTYNEAPYSYQRTSYGALLAKGSFEMSLFQHGAEIFFHQCKTALAEGTSLAEVIKGYFDFDD
jgi:hypothetical protein